MQEVLYATYKKGSFVPLKVPFSKIGEGQKVKITIEASENPEEDKANIEPEKTRYVQVATKTNSWDFKTVKTVAGARLASDITIENRN